MCAGDVHVWVGGSTTMKTAYTFLEILPRFFVDYNNSKKKKGTFVAEMSMSFFHFPAHSRQFFLRMFASFFLAAISYSANRRKESNIQKNISPSNQKSTRLCFWIIHTYT
eukprot:GEMP01089842.1.p1 GENE.GEMP01089842.1~~GEMP01089842.1.p1  ORF type:complete len:110 (-),score=10.00 GEMP01089842.1:529-858(-)